MATVQQYESGHPPEWCLGCGNFPILIALKNALVQSAIDPKDTVVVSGIGCSGKLPHFVKTYAYESLHGRSLPVATGVKLGNHKLTVIAVGGDGDGYGIGMGHFIHAMRRNLDLTYIVHNNQVYGLTTGQTAPTSEKGYKSKSTPHGVLEEPVNPLALAISSGATYVARTFSGDLPHMVSTILGAIRHKGFALVDVLQPCVTFNKINTYPYFMQRVYKLDAGSYNAMDKQAALAKSFEWGDKIPIGIFYKEDKPTYEDGIPHLQEMPTCKRPLDNISVDKILDELQ